MLEHERPHLMPMPAPFDGYVEKPARVSSTCLVSVARNRYSVPCELVGQMVSTRLYPGQRGRRGRRQRRRRSRPAERRRRDPLRLAALHPAAADGSPGRCATARRSPTCPSRCSGCAAALLRHAGRRPRDGAGAGHRADGRAGRGAGGGGAGAGDGAARQGERRACGQRAGPAERRAGAAERGDHAAGDAGAAGQHGALRPPARRQRRRRHRRGGQPCA